MASSDAKARQAAAKAVAKLMCDADAGPCGNQKWCDCAASAAAAVRAYKKAVEA